MKRKVKKNIIIVNEYNLEEENTEKNDVLQDLQKKQELQRPTKRKPKLTNIESSGSFTEK